MWSAIASDQFGQYASVSVDPQVYSETAIFKAAYWFTDRCFIFLDGLPDGRVSVEIRAKGDQPLDLAVACADFCNALIDFRVRDIVAKETSVIREALVRKAFIEGVPKPGLDGAKSDERHIVGT